MIVPGDFLHSLASWMAGRAADLTPPESVAYASTPRALWIHAAQELNAADPYTVLRIYGGPPTSWSPLTRLSVQVQTVASAAAGDAAGFERSWAMFQTLLDDSSRPLRMQTIPGLRLSDGADDGQYLLVYVDALQRTGFTGRDDRGRAMVTFNVEIGVARPS